MGKAQYAHQQDVSQHVVFGGREHSGLAMGGIPETIRDLSVEKLVVFRSPGIPG